MKTIKIVFILIITIFLQVSIGVEAAPKCGGGNPNGSDPACWTSETEPCRWRSIGTIYSCNNDGVLCSDGWTNSNAGPCPGTCDSHGGQGSRYGEFKKGNCGLWCTNDPEPGPVKKDTCYYIDKYDDWTECVSGVQVGTKPHWTSRSGKNCSNASATKSCPMPVCTGIVPTGGIKCSGDEVGLTVDIPWQKATGGCTSARKCEYVMSPECGSANEESYKRTSELTLPDIRCAAENVMSNWLDQSEFATASGIAWTWKCNRSSLDVDCLAYKMGECVDPDPTVGPYNSRNDACRFGAFNSVRLGTDDILRWQCGTGTSAKHIGSFISNDSGSGALVAVDYYGPREGGVECQCTPSYQYECIATNAYVNNETCINRCGENIVQIYQAVKKDETCFINEPAILIGKAEYFDEVKSTCHNESVLCPPCGTQEGEGGSPRKV